VLAGTNYITGAVFSRHHHFPLLFNRPVFQEPTADQAASSKNSRRRIVEDCRMQVQDYSCHPGQQCHRTEGNVLDMHSCEMKILPQRSDCMLCILSSV